MGLGIALLRMDEMRELGGITDKEHRGIVEDLDREHNDYARVSRTRYWRDVPNQGYPPLCGF